MHHDCNPPSRKEEPKAYRSWRLRADLKEMKAADRAWWEENRWWVIVVAVVWVLGLNAFEGGSYFAIIAYMAVGGFIFMNSYQSKERFKKEAVEDFNKVYPPPERLSPSDLSESVLSTTTILFRGTTPPHA